MFYLTRKLIGYPFRFLFWLGTPFHYEEPSNLRNTSDYDIKRCYDEKWHDHFDDRIGYGILHAALLFITILAVLFVPHSFGVIFTILFLSLLFCLFFDGIALGARYYHITQVEKKAETTGALVPQNYYKDTSLTSVLKKKKEEVERWKAENADRVQAFRNRHGRDPNSEDIRHGI